MAIQAEIWETDIVGNLYKDNEFLQYAYNADQYVVGGRAVHIPNAAAASGVVVNRSSLPASVNQRTDVDITYSLDEYTSNPILIPNIDIIQLAYDKRASVMAEDMANLKQVQADQLLYKWGAGITTIVRTTGSEAATTSPGATGTRKLFTKADLLTMKIAFDKQNVPATDRYALLPPDFLGQLLVDKDLAVNFAKYADIANGIVGQVYGFTIMTRATVFTFNNASTPVLKTVGAAAAATDNLGAFCWQKNSVERALGTVKMFEQLSSPQYYGDIYSFLVMMGGRVRRNDGYGIGAIVETLVS